MRATERILIVDDEPDVREVLAWGLRALGYDCEAVADASHAMQALEEVAYALMLSDIRMPQISGLQLLKYAREYWPDVAVIMVTAMADRDTAVSAMRMGAYDFIVKPFEFDEVGFSVARALEQRRLALEVKAYQADLERKVSERTRELLERNEQLQQMLLGTVETIAITLEVRDEYTAFHSDRVARISVGIAEVLGLSSQEVEQIRLAALLHDIGKIGIRESVLHKQGKLTDEEFEHIKTHPLVAERILQPIKPLRNIIASVKHEHEHYDGNGYPSRLKGEEIPLAARIIAVADAYDALTSDRPYRPALSHEQAFEILREGAGRVWDPRLVEVFCEIWKP
jgi:putative two-component system response regulator